MSLDARFSMQLGTFSLAATLQVDAGETVALVGPNGAGKSTTLRAITGLCGADHGHIRLAGALVDDGSEYKNVPGRTALLGPAAGDLWSPWPPCATARPSSWAGPIASVGAALDSGTPSPRAAALGGLGGLRGTVRGRDGWCVSLLHAGSSRATCSSTCGCAMPRSSNMSCATSSSRSASRTSPWPSHLCALASARFAFRTRSLRALPSICCAAAS